MRLGVDFSSWGGALSDATVECWKAQGVDHAVVQYSERMPQHLNVLADAGGIEIEAYVYLYWGASPWGQTPADRVRLALRMMQGHDIKRLWLDCEDQAQSFRPDQLDECIEVCRAAGMPCGIYTGGWWWRPYTSNSTRYSHLPLWDARYLGEAPTPDLSKMPKDLTGSGGYGGWEDATIWQWWNTTSLCGHSVDLNALEGVIAPAPTPEEDYIMANPVWAFWKDGPPAGNVGYRTYLLYATPAGLKKDYVESGEQEQALINAGIITRKSPKPMRLEDLKQYAGGPEPDA